MSNEWYSFFPDENVIFLSFEGIEGCGKSTQIKLLTEYLSMNTDYNVYQFREPGGTTFGESLREAMLGSEVKISALSEALLFASSRCQLLEEKVLPLLKTKKNIIIYDRYFHSSLAYQGFGSNLGHETVTSIHQQYPLTVMPHLTIYLEIDIETSKKRQEIRNQKKDYFESKRDDFYIQLIEGYDHCKKHFPSFKTIDGRQDILAVQNEIQQAVIGLMR